MFENLFKDGDRITNKAECEQKLQRKEQTDIDKNDTEELRDIIRLKKTKSPLFSIDYKVMKKLVSGIN